jgi:tetratricopeptide (TPR) repeat protein
MATRVNTRFVVLLTAVLLVASAGVVGAVVFLLYHTGSDLARMGDKQMALGNFKDADELYSKAVNKEPTNTAFLNKWIESLKAQTPQTQSRYMDAYHKMGSAMRQLALVNREDPAMQRAYLDMEKQALEQSPVKRDALDGFIREADTFIGQYPPGPGPADQLKRYRGMMKLRVVLEVPDADKSYADGAREDLEAALAADPSVSEAARGLELYYAYTALKEEAAGRREEADAAVAKGDKVVSDFLAAHPNDPLIMLVAMRRDLDAASRAVSRRTDSPDLKDLSDKFREQALPKLDAASAAAMAMPPDKVGRQLLGTMRQMEMAVDPAARLRRTEALLRAALSAKPRNAELIGTLADLQESRDDHATAVATLQQIVDMPDQPVSLEGALLFDRRPDAMLRQGLWMVRQWQLLQSDSKERDGPNAKAALEKVKDIRGKLAAVQEAGSMSLLLLDAELAFMEGDDAKAARLLEQFNKGSNNASADALMIGAQVALRRNEPGQARDLLRNLLAVQPSNIRAAYLLATLDATQLQQYEEARQLYEAILRVMPDNKAAADGLNVVKAMMSGVNAKVDDPVIEAVIKADALAKDSTKADGPAQAAALLRDAIAAKGQDPRLVRQLAIIQWNNGQRDAAREALQEGIKANPDNKELGQLAIVMGQTTDELTIRLNLVDNQNLSEARRHGERYVVYKAFGKRPEALAELGEAQKAGPDDPAVLELVFMQALEDKELDKAKALSDRAQKEDLDKAGGATYRARLESVQGHGPEGVRIMEEYVKGGGVQPEGWRLLGRLQNQVGRRADAVKSFKAALELRPSDVATIKDLLNTQVVMQQTEDALQTARQYKEWARNDPDFNNVWLSLEAQAGNRKLVIEQRERLRTQTPSNRDNLMALAGLYMDANQFDKAREILDAVRGAQDGLDAVNLDAGWYFAQRQPDKAKSIFETFIASRTEKKDKLEALLVLAQFLGQRQDAEGSLAALDRAREFQDPKMAQADRVIGDTMLALHREDDAIAAFKRVVDAGADTPEHAYAKRMIEAMITKKHYAQADAALAPMLAGTPEAVTMLLAADSRGGQGDEKGRRQYLDRAVAQFPNDPMVFVKRGQSLVTGDLEEMAKLKENDKSKYQEKMRDLADAVSDFDRALQLQPELWAALRLRATAYDLMGESEKSVADLKAALAANPTDLDLFRGFCKYLYLNERDRDAEEIAKTIVDKRPGDVTMRLNVGNVFASFGKWEAAARYLGMAFDLDPQDGIAQRYLDYLMSCNPPNLAEAANVIQNKLTPQRIAANPGLLMAQAKFFMKSGQPAMAARSTADSLRLLNPENPRDMVAWYNDVQRLEPDTAKLRTFLDGLIGQGGPATDWLKYFRAGIELQDPSGQRQGSDMLADLLRQAKIPPLRQVTARYLGASLYQQKRYSEAEPVMRAAMAEFPEDAENINNLAYLLAKDLNKPADALPLAEKAAQLSPNSGEILDTLGWVQLLTGKADASVATLTKAQGMAQSPFANATILIHLADALWTQGKKDEARAALDKAAQIVNSGGTAVPDQTKADLAELRKKITGS